MKVRIVLKVREGDEVKTRSWVEEVSDLWDLEYILREDHVIWDEDIEELRIKVLDKE